MDLARFVVDAVVLEAHVLATLPVVGAPTSRLGIARSDRRLRRRSIGPALHRGRARPGLHCDVNVARREQTLGDEVPSRLFRDDHVLESLEPQRLGVHCRLEVRERLAASC